MARVYFAQSRSRGAREGKATDMSPRLNEIQKARNCSNEKRHPRAHRQKLGFNLNPDPESKATEREIQSKWPRPAPSLVFWSSSLLTNAERSAATRRGREPQGLRPAPLRLRGVYSRNSLLRESVTGGELHRHWAFFTGTGLASYCQTRAPPCTTLDHL